MIWQATIRKKLGEPKPLVKKGGNQMASRRRNNIINFRVSDEEKELINKKIELSKLKKEEYFRNVAMDSQIIARDIELLKSIDNLISEINKIGSNINQVAKHANQYGGLNSDDVDYLKERMDIIWQLLKSTLSKLH
jgi:hypothetical protein